MTGVRARTTAVAVVVVGLVLAAGAVVFFLVIRARIESSITDTASARAASIAAVVEAGAPVDPLPGADPETFAQVVDGAGAVVASDRVLAGFGPLSGAEPAPGETVVRRIPSPFEDDDGRFEGLDDDGPYATVVTGVRLGSGTGRVIVAASLEDASEAAGAMRPVLGIGLPVLLGIVGFVTWVLTGRALQPVEAMRAEADRISAAALDRRLPLPEARDEIARLAVTLNSMLDRLQAASVKQRRFVADASHELKSPLAALRAIIEVTTREGDRADIDEVLTDLGHEIDRMQRLVDDLLYLARFDETAPTHGPRPCDLDGIVRDEAASLRQRTGLTVDTSGVGPVRVAGDRGRLAQLVRNLTDNAARHATGTIWLETAARDGAGRLRVADDGPGIPPGDRERVFERFERLDESRTRDTGGAGLGLAVARAIARSHGGDLRVVDSSHGGATLEAVLPLA